jgi:hypothetical protein
MLFSRTSTFLHIFQFWYALFMLGLVTDSPKTLQSYQLIFLAGCSNSSRVWALYAPLFIKIRIVLLYIVCDVCRSTDTTDEIVRYWPTRCNPRSSKVCYMWWGFPYLPAKIASTVFSLLKITISASVWTVVCSWFGISIELLGYTVSR